MIETDSPFLAPVPNRGKNEPSFIIHTAKNYLREKYFLSEPVKKTTNNFNKLFFE